MKKTLNEIRGIIGFILLVMAGIVTVVAAIPVVILAYLSAKVSPQEDKAALAARLEVQRAKLHAAIDRLTAKAKAK